VELVPAMPRVFPVGRLDYETEGLLLLTNDGDLTQLLTHPSHGVVKTYLAEVVGDPAPATVRSLREGVDLDDGPTAPATVTVVQRRGATAAIELGIHEGRNRQVRRMCEAVGHPVLRLVRTRIGPLRDGSLRPGTWRALAPAEVRGLYEAATPARPNPRGQGEARG
jgi:23S rRNA pseudouridine2605 synthase